jgi:hypothetical protein
MAALPRRPRCAFCADGIELQLKGELTKVLSRYWSGTTNHSSTLIEDLMRHDIRTTFNEYGNGLPVDF